MGQLVKPVEYWMAVCLRNGSRIEAAAIRTHKKLMPVIPEEFRERLALAREDELRHAGIEDALSDALWPGEVLKGVGGDQMGWLGSSDDPTWNLAVLNLTERTFRWRMKAFARRARQLGHREVWDGMMGIVGDEVGHVQLVVDIFKASERPTPRTIRQVARALSVLERGDDAMFGEAPRQLGLVPHDGLMLKSGEALIEALAN